MLPSDFTVAQLAERCSEESERFRQGRAHDTGSCLELLRRAVEENNGDAKLAFIAQYSQLVRQKLSEFSREFFRDDELVERVFDKFLAAVQRKTLADFPTLGAVIDYLRRTATTTCIDHKRHRDVEERGEESLRVQLEERHNRDPVNQLHNREIIERIRGHLETGQEKLIFELRFEMDMLPAKIYARFPDRFTSVDEIERILDRIKRRLARDPILQQMLRDFNVGGF